MRDSSPWMSSLSTDQQWLFRKLVVGFLAQRGVPGDVRPDGTFGDGRIELRALADECGELAEEDWPVHIARALGTALAAHVWQQERELRDDVAAALPRLRPRLWADHVLERAEGPPIVSRPWLTGLQVGLSLVLSERVATVFEADVERWSVSLDDLYARAGDNLRADPLLEPTVEPLERLRGDRGGVVYTLQEGPPPIASHALTLARYLPEAVSFGALFVIPHGRAVSYHAITDGPALHRAVVKLATYAHRAFATAPVPLSPHLYWWHEGEMELLPMDHGFEALSFQPPDAFVDEVLAPLDALHPPPD